MIGPANRDRMLTPLQQKRAHFQTQNKGITERYVSTFEEGLKTQYETLVAVSGEAYTCMEAMEAQLFQMREKFAASLCKVFAAEEALGNALRSADFRDLSEHLRYQVNTSRGFEQTFLRKKWCSMQPLLCDFQQPHTARCLLRQRTRNWASQKKETSLRTGEVEACIRRGKQRVCRSTTLTTSADFMEVFCGLDAGVGRDTQYKP